MPDARRDAGASGRDDARAPRRALRRRRQLTNASADAEPRPRVFPPKGTEVEPRTCQSRRPHAHLCRLPAEDAGRRSCASWSPATRGNSCPTARRAGGAAFPCIRAGRVSTRRSRAARCARAQEEAKVAVNADDLRALGFGPVSRRMDGLLGAAPQRQRRDRHRRGRDAFAVGARRCSWSRPTRASSRNEMMASAERLGQSWLLSRRQG